MRKPEALIQARIQGSLKCLGYMSIHIPNRGFWNPAQGRYNIRGDAYFIKGVPDLVVLLPEAKVLWVEVKAPKGKRSPAQELMAQTLAERGHNYVLARDVQTVMDWLKGAGYKYGECL